MAITFTKSPSNDNIIPAYNNCIFEFSSTLTDVTHAIVENTVNGYALKIYPNPSGVFWVNLKDLFKTFFEIRDEKVHNLGTSPSTFFADPDMGGFVDITFTVHNATTNENTTNTYILHRAVVEDLETQRDLSFQSISPLKYTCFAGFPFDVTIYNNANKSTGYISRYPNSIINQNIKAGFSRVYENITNPSIYQIGDGTTVLNYTHKVLDCDGVYLKWLAKDGSWRYWLFSEKRKEVVTAKSLGQIDNDFYSISESNNPIIEIGKQAEKTTTLYASGIEDYEHENINTIFESPKIYRYMLPKGSVPTSIYDWKEVELATSNVTTNSYGKNKFEKVIEIRERRNTMSLV